MHIRKASAQSSALCFNNPTTEEILEESKVNERGEWANGRERWSRNPPYLLISPEKWSGVGKEASQIAVSGGTPWRTAGGTGGLAGDISGGETDRRS